MSDILTGAVTPDDTSPIRLLKLAKAAQTLAAAGGGGGGGVTSLNGASGALALTTLAGYGITDAQPTARVLHTNGTSTNYQNGADTAAARGTALLAAKAAAASGDTITVGPGTFAVTDSLAKHGVNWHFAPGASVSRSDEAVAALWDDGNTAMTFNVTGAADFSRTRTLTGLGCDVIKVEHASSVVRIKGRDFTVSGNGSGSGSVLYQKNGDVEVIGRHALGVADGGSYCLWWFNGRGICRFSTISGDYCAVAAEVNDAPTGDFHVYAEEILRSVVNFGINAAAACWIHCNIIKDTVPENGVIVLAGGSKMYVAADKIYGIILASSFSGLGYITARKHTQTADGVVSFAQFVTLDGTTTGTMFYDVDHQDARAFSGVDSEGSFIVDGGTLHMERANFDGNSTSKGLLVRGGICNVYPGVRISTALNSGTSPVTKDGGTLILGAGVALLAHSTANSITAATAQNVKAYGGVVANRLKHANVTIQVGSLTVDANVT